MGNVSSDGLVEEETLRADAASKQVTNRCTTRHKIIYPLWKIHMQAWLLALLPRETGLPEQGYQCGWLQFRPC